MFTFRVKSQSFSTFHMPGDVTGIVTLPLTATPTGREYDHFCFPDEEAEAQRVK